MISQKDQTISQKGGHYRFTYQEYIKVKQLTYQLMIKYNKTHKQYINYEQTYNKVLKLPTKTILNLIAQYQELQYKKQNKQLTEHNQQEIIVKSLQNITDQQLEQITTQLQRLEELYDLQLDTDYTDKQSIIRNYQQVLAYKYYHIHIDKKQDITNYGNQDLYDTIIQERSI